MIGIYKVLSAALSYPTVELQDAASELMAVLNAEQLLPAGQREAIVMLISDIAEKDILEVQAQYVELFDRTRALSLHMFEHVHGESRDRGQAMVSLLERYRQAGLDLNQHELPDYIPLFLEYLSTEKVTEARANLADPAHIFAALGERLRKRRSHYAAVFEALVTLSHATLDMNELEELREQGVEDPADLAALDKTWEEAEVRFGPGDSISDQCSRASAMLERMGAAMGPNPVHRSKS